MSKRNKNKQTKTSAKPQPSAQSITHQVTNQKFSGPIPPPSILEGYEIILPGAAERILQMAEGDASHQRDMENKAIKATMSEVRVGQVFGLIVSLSALALAGVAVIYSQPWVAGILGSGTLVGIITAFRYKSK